MRLVHNADCWKIDAGARFRQGGMPLHNILLTNISYSGDSASRPVARRLVIGITGQPLCRILMPFMFKIFLSLPGITAIVNGFMAFILAE